MTDDKVMVAPWEFHTGPSEATCVEIMFHLVWNSGIGPKPTAGDWDGAGCCASVNIKAKCEEMI